MAWDTLSLMAQLYPTQWSSTAGGHAAEFAVRSALSATLDDSWHVYHGTHVLSAEGAKTEADFVCLHPEHGLLVLECKGHGVECRPDGSWWRSFRGRVEPLKESPFAQAQRQVKTLLGELKGRLPGVALPHHGSAVVFPFTKLTGTLPLGARRETAFDEVDLPRLGARVEAALAFYAQRHDARTLDARSFAALRRALEPTLGFVEVGGPVHEEAKQLVQLSEEQLLVLGGVVGGGRVRVAGSAGSGKTLIALAAAKRLAAEGKRVLFVCFNRALATHLAKLAPPGDGALEVTTFHGLCRQAFGELDVPFHPPSGAAAGAFWEHEAPMVLLDALASGALAQVDAVFVDEGQDFAADWLTVMEAYLKPGGTLAIFYDPAQAIFGKRSGLSAAPPTLQLTCNFRNSQRVVDTLRALGVVTLAHPRSPEGEAPTVREARGAAKDADAVERVVRARLREGFALESIAVLSPHRRERTCLAGLDSLGEWPLSDDPSDRAGKLLHTTFGAFKGLEADAVIMTDVDPGDPRCDRAARYVAASRAKLRLDVIAKGGDWLRR